MPRVVVTSAAEQTAPLVARVLASMLRSRLRGSAAMMAIIDAVDHEGRLHARPLSDRYLLVLVPGSSPAGLSILLESIGAAAPEEGGVDIVVDELRLARGEYLEEVVGQEPPGNYEAAAVDHQGNKVAILYRLRDGGRLIYLATRRNRPGVAVVVMERLLDAVLGPETLGLGAVLRSLLRDYLPKPTISVCSEVVYKSSDGRVRYRLDGDCSQEYRKSYTVRIRGVSDVYDGAPCRIRIKAPEDELPVAEFTVVLVTQGGEQELPDVRVTGIKVSWRGRVVAKRLPNVNDEGSPCLGTYSLPRVKPGQAAVLEKIADKVAELQEYPSLNAYSHGIAVFSILSELMKRYGWEPADGWNVCSRDSYEDLAERLASSTTGDGE